MAANRGQQPPENSDGRPVHPPQNPYSSLWCDQNPFRSPRSQTSRAPKIQSPNKHSPRYPPKCQVRNPYCQFPKTLPNENCSNSQEPVNIGNRRPLADSYQNRSTPSFLDTSSMKNAYMTPALSQQTQQSLSSHNSSLSPSPAPISRESKQTQQQTRNSNSKFAPTTAFKLLNKDCQEEDHRIQNTLYLVPSPTRIQNHSWLKLRLGITEIAGAAGSGKSQLAMNVCVQAALSNRQQNNTCNQDLDSYKAIYISLAGGRGSLSRIAHRMQQIADGQRQFQNCQSTTNIVTENAAPVDNNIAPVFLPPSNYASIDNGTKSSVLSQILTRGVSNQEDLLVLLRKELPELLEAQQQEPKLSRGRHQPARRNPVSVIVLDSIADFFRVGNGEGAYEGKSNLTERSALMFEIAALLRRLSDQYGIPIVVINQVSQNFANGSTIPALGLTWANCVNTTFLLRRPSDTVNRCSDISINNKNAGGSPRQIFLIKSPHHRVDESTRFQICNQGIVPFS